MSGDVGAVRDGEQRVEARDAAKHPTRHRMVSHNKDSSGLKWQ